MRWTFAVLICWCAGVAGAGEFRAGAAVVTITPPMGAPMSGYYFERAAEGVHDDLGARALVFEKDGTKAAIVTCDLIGLSADVVAQSRRLIEAATGIAGDHVMISATHTHTGPVIPDRSTRDTKSTSAAGKILAGYIATLPGRIAEAVTRADAALAPATLALALGHEDSVSFNRRFFMTDGTVGWNPGKRNPNIVKPAGPIDPNVAVVYVAAAGRPIATYVNFACHLDTVGGLDYSADYPHTLYALLARIKGPDMVTLFAQGCSGNINHFDVTWADRQRGHGEAARIGTVLTGEVLKTTTRLQPVPANRIAARCEIAKLPLAEIAPEDIPQAREVTATYGTPQAAPFMELVQAFKVLGVAKREGRPIEAEVQVIALGDDIAWVGLPGEIFVEIGMAIKRNSPFRYTMVTELANGSIGYVPDRKAYAEGNYEPVSSRCGAASGAILVDTSVRLLKALKSDGQQYTTRMR